MMRPTKGCISLLTLSLLLATVACAADGKAKAQICSACHGQDGNSINAVWPNLAGQHVAYTVQQLKAFKSNARSNPSMSPMVANLSEVDMHEIAVHYAAQPPKIANVNSAEIVAGQRLYRGGDRQRGIPACMACHSPNGAGNAAANYPALRGQHAQYTVLQLQAYATGERHTDPQQMMRTIAGKLSAREMESVAKYISALH